MTKRKKTKGQTTIYKTLYKKLKTDHLCLIFGGVQKRFVLNFIVLNCANTISMCNTISLPSNLLFEFIPDIYGFIRLGRKSHAQCDSEWSLMDFWATESMQTHRTSDDVYQR